MPARERSQRPAPETARTPRRSPSPSPSPAAAWVLALQRAMGNSAVSSLLDADEHARDETPVQRSGVEEVLSSPGTPLADPVRAEMEARLGADFSDVRLHSGPAAQRSAAEVGARAYTAGSHVVIGEAGSDKHTLAHELTHVIQQRSGPVAGTDNGGGLRISDPSDRFEREAEANAHRVMAGQAPVPAEPEGQAIEPAGLSDDGEISPKSGRLPVQRMIVTGDIAEPDGTIERDQVRQAVQGRNLHPDHIERLEEFADDDGNVAGLEEAIRQTRNTVVAAVDGSRGAPEGDFLKSAHRLRNNVSAYDPNMNTRILESMGIPATARRLTQGSVTGFGDHVPHTDLLVPHPGPWAKMGPPDGLADCIEKVLGPHSVAYILTDNETTDPSQSKTVETRIHSINQEKATVTGYVPLQVTVEDAQVTANAGTGARHTNLGGARLTIGHEPPYRLITIRRS